MLQYQKSVFLFFRYYVGDMVFIYMVFFHDREAFNSFKYFSHKNKSINFL